ncbi:MAG: hypothetical protein DSZ24_05845 [Thermodesulfatator sp.]|nr:MAG: hypothetical protein DSZ24_05845 [Thermodesulfatator sp.]
MWAGLAQAARLELHGQFGVKVQTTNSWGMIGKKDAQEAHIMTTTDEQLGNDLDDTWASLQFRLWATAASDDGKVKGIWAMEVGSVNFGEENGLELHNESTNIESRIMSVEFALPFGQSLGLKLRAGLSPYYVNRYLWNETAPGIDLSGKVSLGKVDTSFLFFWVRAADHVSSTAFESLKNNDFDAYAAVLNFDLSKVFNVDKAMLSLFTVYLDDQRAVESRGGNWYVVRNVTEYDQLCAAEGANCVPSDSQPWYVGGDLQFKVMGFDVDLGGIYLGGDAPYDNDYDAWLVYADLGYEINEQLKVSFNWWWASGDDDPYDDDVENYLAIDTHTEGSVVLFEDAAFDDGYVVSRHPYLNELGFLMYRLRVDWKPLPKLSLALAGNYMQLDEDSYWVDESGRIHEEDDSIGWELDFYVKYELYPGLTVDLAAGYLWADDALDAYAYNDCAPYNPEHHCNRPDDDADDMYRVSLGVTYTF